VNTSGSSVQNAGSYKVREVHDLSAKEWDELVTQSPGGGHIFQSHAWAEFKRNLGWSPIRVVMEKDGEIIGVGQFLSYNTFPVPGRMMFCPKGPWIPWEDEEAVRAFFEGVGEIAREHRVHTVKIEPEVREEDVEAKALLSDIGFNKFRWDLNHKTSYLVDLSRSEEDILAGMKSRARYNTRLADRKGVEIVEDDSKEAQEAFWDMFEVTARRNDFWYRPKEYQLGVWRTMFEAGRAHLFFAVHEGDKLAGSFALIFGQRCWYFQSASTNEKRNLKPPHLMQWEMMKWAKKRGVIYYDMMAIPSPEELENEDHPLHGVYKFKAGFGGEVVDSVGCLDLPVNPVLAELWNRVEPTYYRLYRKLKGDVYY
jgi:lipid II:glycine glycyltransferase (peptidoglycan interpeptide bridge formation enzyme)